MNGYKTYIVAGLIGLATVAHTLGWIDDTVYQVILGLLGAGGLAALRAGVTKSGTNIEVIPSGPGEFPGIDAGPGTK